MGAKQGSSQPPPSFNSTFGRLISFLTATALIQVSLTFDLLHYSSSPLTLLSYGLCPMPANLSSQTWVYGIILLLNNLQWLVLSHLVQTGHSGTENPFSPAPAYFVSLIFPPLHVEDVLGSAVHSQLCVLRRTFLGPGIFSSHYSNLNCLLWATSNLVSCKD